MTTPDSTTLSQTLATIAADAALSVGDFLVDAFNQDVSAQEKNGFYDLVTVYDQKAEEMITEYILRHHPDSTIVGEEGGARGNGAVHWYVDPIDGTTNFAVGIPFFCVSIGAALNGNVLAGAIYDPVRKEMFHASTGGAFLNKAPIRAGGFATDSSATLISAFPLPGRENKVDDYHLFRQMVSNFKAVRRLGSAALSLAYVACERADAAFEPAINPWDVAAGYLLLTQAGGRYLPVGQNSQPQLWRAPGFLALGSEFRLEESVLKAIAAG